MEEYEVISIPVSDGTERDFAIMDTFEFEGQGYLAVSLIEGDEIQEGVYIYRYHNAEDGDVVVEQITLPAEYKSCLLYTSPSPRDGLLSRMPSSA